MRTVYFKNIHTGKGERSKWLYCSLYDAVTDELVMAATMDYATRAITERNYTVVPEFVGYTVPSTEA